MEEKQIFGYVYLVKNLVNGKMYFGITENDFDNRYGGNIAKHTHNDHLKHSIKKYGIENFEINKEFDVAYTEDDLYELEDMYMCIYNTLDPRYGYNKQRSGSKRKGHGKMSEESKKRMSDSTKKTWENKEYRRKQVELRKGKPHTEETKHKQSVAQKGRKKPQEVKYKQSETMKSKYRQGYVNPKKGKPLSEETRKKISDNHADVSGEKHPMHGKPRSDETKKKISENHADFTGSKHPQARKTICMETLQVFNCIKDAAEWCGGNVKQYLIGRSKSAGKHPITKEPLHWMYYDEYLKLQEEQSNKTQDLVTEVA